MTRPPDPTAHATHDLELVASYASGDATGADLDTATALVAGCPDCAALHRDLRAIAAALPGLPVPTRPRDFRLTPGQAASLRPRGWRRIAAAFAGPGFRFAAPLGTGLATLGLAGLLLGTLGGSPLLGGIASSGGAGGAAPLNAYDSNAYDSNAGAPPEKAAPSAAAAPLASAAPSAAPSVLDQVATVPRAAASAPASPAEGAMNLASEAPAPVAGPSGGDALLVLSPPGGSPLTWLGALGLVAGAVLVAARLAARRLTRRA